MGAGQWCSGFAVVVGGTRVANCRSSKLCIGLVILCEVVVVLVGEGREMGGHGRQKIVVWLFALGICNGDKIIMYCDVRFIFMVPSCDVRFIYVFICALYMFSFMCYINKL